jgi:hypothetical protein
MEIPRYHILSSSLPSSFVQWNTSTPTCLPRFAAPSLAHVDALVH